MFNQNMRTVEETRHERLLMLRVELGSVAKLAEKIEKDYSQVSQWVNKSMSASGKPRTINSESARFIEEKCGKPVGWMDWPVTLGEVNDEPIFNEVDYKNMSVDELINYIAHLNVEVEKAKSQLSAKLSVNPTDNLSLDPSRRLKKNIR